MNGLSEFSDPSNKQERRERRARLEREGELVRAQILELKSQLPQLQRAGPSIAPSKQGGVSKKRPAHGLGEPVTKRQKVELERSRRVSLIWQQCQTIWKTLSKSKDANVFMKPVNPTVMKCLDYFDIVKKPMDLGTIQKKFPGKPKISGRGSEPRSYTSPLEFRNDMRLVWDNCRLYNAINTPVRGMGEAMADAWEKKWKLSGIEVKWEEEQQRQNLEEQDLAGGQDLAQQLPSLHDLLVRKVTHKESLPGYTASPEGSAMNFEQKRRLSISIGQLPGDRLSEVLRIIAEDNSMLQKADGEEEMEVDINALSTEVLWKLHHFTKSILQNIRKKPGQKPADVPGGASQPEAAPATGDNAKQPNGSGGQGRQGSSSSSSSDSGTDRSGSDSEGASKDLGGPSRESGGIPAGQRQNREADHDAVTLVSVTRPPGQPQIVKPMAQKKEVNLQNENAWADLGNINAADDIEADEGEPGTEDDNLWDEFKSREQEEEQREKEKKAEEEKQRQEQQQREDVARAEAEQKKKEAEEREKTLKEEEAAKLEAQRAKEMEEMQNVGKGENFGIGAQELMDSKKQGSTLNELGLQRRGSSDSESASGND